MIQINKKYTFHCPDDLNQGEYKDKDGTVVEVIGQEDNSFLIRAKDGWEGEAYEDELGPRPGRPNMALDKKKKGIIAQKRIIP